MDKVIVRTATRRLVAGLILGFVWSLAPADDAADTAAFKATYSAYQKHEKNDDFERAMPEAKSAYEIGLRIYGKEHKNTAALAYNYGLTLIEVGALDDARKILRQAVTLYGGAYGKNSAELIPVLMDLGHTSAKALVPARQTKHYKRALKLARNHYGPDSERYGHLLLAAGTEVLNVAQSRMARPYLQDAYKVLQAALGDDHIATGMAAFHLARFEMATKRFADAEGHLLAALNTFEDSDRPSSPFEIGTHARLVAVYEEMGEPAKATAHCQAIGRMTPFDENQHYMPLFRTQPRYPLLAQQDGKEGYVDVEFTVDHEGIVRDPKVISGNFSFKGAALDAVSKWRYAPRFVDGQPVESPNVLTRLRFEFAD